MALVVWYFYQKTNTVYVSNKCLHITHCNSPFVACFPIPEQYHTFSNLLKCLVSLIVCYVILHQIVREGGGGGGGGGLCANTHIRCNFLKVILLIICLWTLSEYSVLCFWEKALQQQFNVNSTGWNKALYY